MIKRFVIYLLLSLLVIELAGNLLGFFKIEPTGYRLVINAEALDDHNGYADRDSMVGVWHRPNDVWIQAGPCYTTEMRSNQFGARDNHWDTTKKGNLFLGSSFIEGFGVDYGKRVSEYFESLTGKEVFNCGMAGDFSPVQYYMTLKKFHKKIEFDTCYVFFVLPTDDSLTWYRDEKRFRPYLTDTGIAYTRSHASYPEFKTFSQKLSQLVYQYSYSYHLYTYFKSRNYLKSSLLANKQGKPKDFPYVKKMINKFCEDYPDLFFYFVFIPTLTDQHVPKNIQLHPNMKIIDLTKSLDHKQHYLICNSHWNEPGHKKLAEALYSAICSDHGDQMTLKKSP
jgi:hypothetical protein